MVRPAHFGYNPETAENNAFQSSAGAGDIGEIKSRAEREFDDLVEKMRNAGIEVWVHEDTRHVVKPDAIFPNNWFTTHEDGTLITYPMYSPVRRLERDPVIIEKLKAEFEVGNRIEMERFELDSKYLEATGSMILDRINKKAYACISERTHHSVLEEFSKKFGYEVVSFEAIDPKGIPVYHTNVIMTLGAGFAIVCMDCIPDAEERNKVRTKLEASGIEVVEITFEQVVQYAGNMLQLLNAQGNPVLAMSSSAFRSLTPAQKATLEKYTEIVHSDIPTIEKFGGGSVRCMIAENFLPSK